MELQVIEDAEVIKESIMGRASIDSIVKEIAMVNELYSKVMQPNVHYGVIPGTKKPSLYKAGAEKIMQLFQVAPFYEIKTVEDGNHREYTIVCTLKRDGKDIGQGLGVCSTKESKYAFKTQWIDKVKHKYDTENLADVYNTCIKMGKKRALVDASLSLSACSDIFTQDLEDIKENAEAFSKYKEANGEQNQKLSKQSIVDEMRLLNKLPSDVINVATKLNPAFVVNNKIVETLTDDDILAIIRELRK